jgi:UMF1 family MFS transporter
VIELTGSSRNAIVSVVVFFLVGGLLLSKVDVTQGRAAVVRKEEQIKDNVPVGEFR